MLARYTSWTKRASPTLPLPPHDLRKGSKPWNLGAFPSHKLSMLIRLAYIITINKRYHLPLPRAYLMPKRASLNVQQCNLIPKETLPKLSRPIQSSLIRNLLVCPFPIHSMANLESDTQSHAQSRRIPRRPLQTQPVIELTLKQAQVRRLASGRDTHLDMIGACRLCFLILSCGKCYGVLQKCDSGSGLKNLAQCAGLGACSSIGSSPTSATFLCLLDVLATALWFPTVA